MKHSSAPAMVLIPLVLVQLLGQGADAVTADECQHYTSSDEPIFMGPAVSKTNSSKVTKTYRKRFHPPPPHENCPL